LAGVGGESGVSAYTTQSTSGGNNPANVSSVEQQIIQVILNHPQHKEGVHIAAIARAIGGDPHVIR
jgi:replication factor A2